MKIFNLIQSVTATTEIQQLQINLHIDDLESLIQYLHQSSDHNEITLMAEHPAENQLVLDYATKYWFGCGLYHPDLNQLNQKQLYTYLPKIILLKPNDPHTDAFVHIGHVLFNEDEYQHQVKQLVHWVSPLGDGD